MNALQLTEKQAELSARISELQDRLGAALLDGKDTSRLTMEVTNLEAEQRGIKNALALLEHRKAEQNEEARRRAADQARQEVGQINARLDDIAGSLADTLQALQSLANEYQNEQQRALGLVWLNHLDNTRVNTYGPAAQIFRVVSTMLPGIDWLQRHYPEPFGLPPIPTKIELAIQEAESYLERAKARVAQVREMKKRPFMPGDPSIDYESIEREADTWLKRAQTRLDELKKQLG